MPETSEAIYTAPSAFCPHPERWQAVDCSAAEVEVSDFLAALVRFLKPDWVLETGTYLGITAQKIGRALRENGVGRLITLEVNPEYAEAARLRCEGLPVDVIVGESSKYRPSNFFNLAFFDSRQEDRVLNFLKFRVWLGGAIVCFHDTAPHHLVGKDVKKAERRGLIKTINFHTPRGLTIAEVLP